MRYAYLYMREKKEYKSDAVRRATPRCVSLVYYYCIITILKILLQ